MKKLGLKLNAFDKEGVLTRAQLKKVIGGDDGSGSEGDRTYFCQCADGNTITIADAPTVQVAREVAREVARAFCRAYLADCHP